MTPTMNRVDLLSMVGLAREVATLFDGELLPVDVDDPPILHPEWVEIVVDDPEGCPRYIGRVFKNVTVGPSPMWLRARLHAAGMRVDLERRRRDELRHARLRQPAARVRPLEARRRAHRRAPRDAPARRCGRSTTRCATLDERDLLITDGTRGGRARRDHGRPRERGRRRRRPRCCSRRRTSSRSASSSTSERLGLRTEGSNRWEKGVDPYLAEPAAVLASRLLVDLTGRRADAAAPTSTRGCRRAPSSGCGRSGPTGSSASRWRRPSSARSSSGSASRSPTTGT